MEALLNREVVKPLCVRVAAGCSVYGKWTQKAAGNCILYRSFLPTAAVAGDIFGALKPARRYMAQLRVFTVALCGWLRG